MLRHLRHMSNDLQPQTIILSVVQISQTTVWIIGNIMRPYRSYYPGLKLIIFDTQIAHLE
jgi:hypothetical protein